VNSLQAPSHGSLPMAMTHRFWILFHTSGKAIQTCSTDQCLFTCSAYDR